MIRSALIVATILVAHAAQVHAKKNAISLVRGDQQVVVVINGVKPQVLRVVDRADRLEVQLAQAPGELQKLDVRDRTVKRVDLVDGPTPRLSIKLHHGRRVTERMAQEATVSYAGGRLRLTIPRKKVLFPEGSDRHHRRHRRRRQRPAETPAEPEAEPFTPEQTVVTPTLPEAAVEIIKTPEAVVLEPAHESDGAPKPLSEPTVDRTQKLVTASADSPDTQESNNADGDDTNSVAFLPNDTQPAPFAVSDGDELNSSLGLGTVFALFVLLLVAALWWVFSRRRRHKGTPIDSIRVLASRTLAAKARVVLIAANNREFLLSVTDKGARVIGRWRQAAHASQEHVSDQRIAPAATDTTSPTVSGILRLRNNLPFVAEDVASEDPEADALWARELFAATHRSPC